MIKELIIKYSRMERTTSVDEVQHPIIRESLKLVGIADPHLEITSMADIPAGTGLGSSGSFTTALLKALHEAGLREVRFRFDFEGTKVVAQS